MKKILELLFILVLGFALVFIFSWQLKRSQPQNENFDDEDLYFSAHQLNLIGSDFKGLVADWYWIKSLQYLGNKIVNHQETLNINDLRPLNPRLVYPMLDSASTLDPQFLTIYSYGAAVLPAIDNQQAIKLMEKGIAENPEQWRIYSNLGYIYWQSKEYQKAADIYMKGASQPNAPVWMLQMGATMAAKGGSHDFARQVYKQMFETAEDEQTKMFAELHYQQIEATDEMEAIRNGLFIFKKNINRCPQTWSEVMPYLLKSVSFLRNSNRRNAQNEPIDPSGVQYKLVNINEICDVQVSKDSRIPAS